MFDNRKTKRLKRFVKKTLKWQDYDNVVDALYVTNVIKKVSGQAVLVSEQRSDGHIVSKFSWLGFGFFALWHATFFYLYKAHVENQEVIQLLFTNETISRGVNSERIISLVYVIVTMWVVPFRISGDNRFIQIIIDVDKNLKIVGETVDYGRIIYSAVVIVIAQVVVYIARLLCVWLLIKDWNDTFPTERMVQDMYSTILALTISVRYCYNLIILKERFQYINNVLCGIKSQTSWENKVFIRSKFALNVQRGAGNLKDEFICGKLKACAMIYGLLFRAVDAINNIFGVAILLNILFVLLNIILYLFYFMEATSRGLFHDVQRYIYFLIYEFWQMGYAAGTIFLIVFFCERVIREAMQLSLQLLHQKPVFKACGFYELNYPLLEQMVKAVCTYLIVLLQFGN